MIARAGVRLLGALFFLLLTLGFLYLTFGYGEQARRVPVVIAVPLVALALIDVVREWVLRFRGIEPVEERAADNEKAQLIATAQERIGAATLDDEPEKPEWVPWVWLGSFVAAVWLFGLAIGGLAFTAAFLKIQGRLKLLPIVAMVAGLAAFIYIVLAQLLSVRLWGGVIDIPFLT